MRVVLCYSQNSTLSDNQKNHVESFQLLNGIRASSMKTLKYIRSFGFMLFEEAVFPQYSGTKNLLLRIQ